MAVKRILATFICTWIVWILFAGAIHPSEDIFYQELLVGGISAAFVSGISYELFTRDPGSMMNPKKWGYLIAYIPAYIWQEIKSHLNVAYRILHPSLPLKPAIVRLPTELKSDVGLTALANSITMTPGTLTVNINPEEEGKSELYVHWISAGSVDTEKAKKEVGEPLERFLRGGLG